MKTFVAVALGVALLLTTASTSLASQGATHEAAPIPTHGSVWFGSGLDGYEPAESIPLHGSVWFGSGLQHYGIDSSLVNSHDVAMVTRGSTNDFVNWQQITTVPELVNSHDVAMITRGSTNDFVNSTLSQLAVNAGD